ncbi:uncharacterized protein LOC135981402 [Chrysemys picta bellii]|uniref:uncharacterized protein LOC135981402 n=1 Tax=Chrysemys picta bellii TaxID=8478 RepID=UPI0032B1B077
MGAGQGWGKGGVGGGGKLAPMVQSQLHSSRRNYNTYRQISRCIIERGHDKDTLQCKVKVKELRNAYHKAQEANHRSSAAPTSCWLYKELDAILSGDPTSTAKAPVDASLAHMPVKSGPSQEEGILDEEGEGDPEAEDDSEARDAFSHELFTTPEDPSQSQQSDLGKAQTGEEAPEMTLGAQSPSLLSMAEWLRRIRKRPRRTKEDLLRDVMMHSAAKKKELKEWWDSEKRDQKENAAHQKEATERLLNVMEHQEDTLQAILALQTEQCCARPSLQPLSQNSFPCAPHTLPTHCYQPPGSTLPAAFHCSLLTVQHCGLPLHSTPNPLQFGPAEVQHPLHCTPKEKVGYDPWTYTNL